VIAFEALFILLANLRAANAASLFELYFKPTKTPLRTAMRRLSDLVDAGLLANLRLDGARRVYHLTEKALALPVMEKWAHASLATRPPDRQAMYCWLRSALFAALTADGWRVGNDTSALFALRRCCIDALEDARSEANQDRQRAWLSKTLDEMRASPALSVTQIEQLVGHRWRCRACGAARVTREHANAVTRAPCAGKLRAVPATPLDIAWRARGKAYEAMVLFIDNPSLPLDRQLEDLNAVCFGEPSIKVIVRATDPRSEFDREGLRWSIVGRRHAELNKALGVDGALHTKIVVVDYQPALQAYVRR
jgi:hypothetical protein